MRYRLLGQTGLRVAEFFLGAMTFASPEEGRRMVDRYAEAGGNVVDTASAYGDSESVLGEIFEGRRDRFVVATKYSLSRDDSDPNAAGNHRKNLTRSLETSLRRLRTDHIDLFWVHLWDRHTPVAETMRALDDAVRAGKVLYVGISNAPAWVVSQANTLAEWHGWTPFAGLQVPYNLGNRDIERELLPMAEAFGMTVATWSPLARGALSGRLTRPGAPAVGAGGPPETIGAREQAAALAVQQVADDVGATQVAIAWTRVRSRAVHPIIGASTAEQLEDNPGAVDVVLPDEAVRRLESAVEFTLGYPGDFIAEVSPVVFGDDFGKVDGRPAANP